MNLSRDLRRGEEGQVYPALLLAVIGGFAISVLFIGLQNLLDQTGRAASASDSAALAVAKDQRKFVERSLQAASSGQLPGQFLVFQQLIGGTLQSPTRLTMAAQFAQANGAGVESATGQPFNWRRHLWTVQATTQQSDTVEGGNRTARSTSKSRATVRITAGLCNKGFTVGVDVGAGCKDGVDILKDCVTTTTPMPYCTQNMLNHLKWEIRLVQ